MFCSSLTSLDVSKFDTSNVTEIHQMFGSCFDLTSLDLSNFDTSKVTNMYRLVARCSSLTSVQMPSDIDTTKPTADMSRLFSACSSLECIDKIDTTNATDASNIFFDCSSLIAPDSNARSNIENKVNQPWINPDSCPNTTDLDNDGKPDEDLYDGPTIFGQTKITKDEDSINIDLDGDGIADIIIPR